jgi:hypothetical protein
VCRWSGFAGTATFSFVIDVSNLVAGDGGTLDDKMRRGFAIPSNRSPRAGDCRATLGEAFAGGRT